MNADFDPMEVCKPICAAAGAALYEWETWSRANPHDDATGALLQQTIHCAFLAVAAGIVPTLRMGADEATICRALHAEARHAIEHALIAARARPPTIGSA